jgi:hypothetical protein
LPCKQLFFSACPETAGESIKSAVHMLHAACGVQHRKMLQHSIRAYPLPRACGHEVVFQESTSIDEVFPI